MKKNELKLEKNLLSKHVCLLIFALIDCHLLMQTFLVRKSTSMQKKVISVRMDHNTELLVQDFPVRENKYSRC